MCGIAGEVCAARIGLSSAVVDILKRLRHRGPDAMSIISKDGITMGCARLAISGPIHVPSSMSIPEAPIILSYNGEVYGLSLQPDESDTMWLLKSLHARGLNMLEEIDGMYAIGLANLENGELSLARDPFGIKPLYVSMDLQKVRYASELGALWTTEPVDPIIEPTAFMEYIGLGCRLDNETPFPGIVSLPPGTLTTICRVNGALQSKDSYLKSRVVELPAAPADEILLGKAITDSIISCAETPQRLGLFLSGGLDSTAIATVLADQGREGVYTFSLLLGEDGVRSLDQLNLPGKAWRTWTHEYMVPTDDQLDNSIEKLSSFTSQPCYPLSAAYTLMLAEMAAAKGVRVVLSGEGADELFGGYDSYLHFFRTKGKPLVEDFYLEGVAIRWTRRLLGKSSSEIIDLVKSRLHCHARRAEDPLRRLLNYEVPLSLGPLLERLDHTSMHYSLEVRLPFLHGDVPAIASALGESQRTKLRTTKPVLRQALCYLNGAPPHLASIPKRPLRVSLQQWLNENRRQHMINTLDSSWLKDAFPCSDRGIGHLIETLRGHPSASDLLVGMRLYQLSRFWQRFAVGHRL